jgi:hypothetical protein
VKTRKSYGHSRIRQVPSHEGTDAKVCSKCTLWFAARPREKLCDGCVPQKVRNARFAADPNWATKAGLKLPGAAGQKGSRKQSQNPVLVTESAILGVRFFRPIPVYLGLALEAAACLDGKRPVNDWKRDPLALRTYQ